MASQASVNAEVEECYVRLRTYGWVVTDDAAIARALISGLGEEEQPQELLAREASESLAGTHSAQYGLRAFPWHTDGALARFPPKFLTLRPTQLGPPTVTELLDLPAEMRRRLRRVTLLVQRSTGKRSYFPVLMRTSTGHERLRWDSRAQVRGDESVAASIGSLTPSAAIKWEMGRVAVIDNYRLLHRRPAVTVGRRLLRTYIGVQQ